MGRSEQTVKDHQMRRKIPVIGGGILAVMPLMEIRSGDDPAQGMALPLVHENLRGASYYGGGEEKPC